MAAGNTGQIIEGPDHNVWFTLPDGFIGVLNLDPSATPSGAVLPTTGVGPESWIAGGVALAVLLVGGILALAGRRRRVAAHRG